MIRVFLADDHTVLRDGLRRLLDDTSDLRVVGEASDGDEVLARARVERWDVLVLDLSLAGKQGREVLRELRAVEPMPPVLVLSMYPPGPWLEQLFDEGARGFLSKAEPAERLIDAVRAVAAGRFVRPALEGPRATDAALHHELTARQLEVLVLLGKGLSPSEIGAALELRSSTVSTHLQRIKAVLGVRTHVELARYAARAGLVPG